MLKCLYLTLWHFLCVYDIQKFKSLTFYYNYWFFFYKINIYKKLPLALYPLFQLSRFFFFSKKKKKKNSRDFVLLLWGLRIMREFSENRHLWEFNDTDFLVLCIVACTEFELGFKLWIWRSSNLGLIWWW